MRLTQVSVSKLQPATKTVAVYDDTLGGFGCRIFPSGVKSWICEYRVAGAGRAGAKRRVTIGNVDKVSLDDARKEARRLFARVAAGSDPTVERKIERESATLANLTADFIAQHVRTKLKPRSAGEYERLLNKCILPTLGPMKLKDLKRRDVARLHLKLSPQGKVQANKAVAVLSAVWNWAARRDIVAAEQNPTRGVERNREQGRERFLTDVELARLGETLRLAESSGLPWVDQDSDKPVSKHMVKAENRFTQVSPYAVAAIRLLILSGARLREILNLRWDSIDEQRGLAFLADSKSGRKTLVLSGAALELLVALPREANSAFCFPGPDGEPRRDLKRPWAAIVQHAELDGLRLHDLRHSAASVMTGSGVSLSVVGAVLGHSQPQTTARYAHVGHSPARAAVDGLAKHVQAAMGDAPAGGQPQDGGKGS